MCLGGLVVLSESGFVDPTVWSRGDDKAAPETLEMLAGIPIACLELLGQSALQRTVQYLRHAGAEAVSLVAKDNVSHLVAVAVGRLAKVIPVQRSADAWAAAQHVFSDFVKNGLKTVLLVRLGAFVEFDFVDLIQFHRAAARPVTRLSDAHGPLDLWVLDAGRCSKAEVRLDKVLDTKDADHIASYNYPRYVTRLADASDLRQFVVDAFLSRCSAKPLGTEIRPGVWVDDSAQIDRRARIVPPAYVGPGTRIRASALITRFSNVERECDIDYGTVVENSSILANTYLGTWLDVSHSVVSGSNLSHLLRNITVEIKDPRLIARTTSELRRRAILGVRAP
jgi:hypothetical protein